MLARLLLFDYVSIKNILVCSYNDRELRLQLGGGENDDGDLNKQDLLLLFFKRRILALGESQFQQSETRSKHFLNGPVSGQKSMRNS